jgi:hypothetical protein
MELGIPSRIAAPSPVDVFAVSGRKGQRCTASLFGSVGQSTDIVLRESFAAEPMT